MGLGNFSYYALRSDLIGQEGDLVKVLLRILELRTVAILFFIVDDDKVLERQEHVRETIHANLPETFLGQNKDYSSILALRTLTIGARITVPMAGLQFN